MDIGTLTQQEKGQGNFLQKGVGWQVITDTPNRVPGYHRGLRVYVSPLLPPNIDVKILPPRSDGLSD